MADELTPEQQAILDEFWASRPEDERPVSWQGTAAVAATLVTLSPIALGVGFLVARAITIRNRPVAEREEARHLLGAWPRFLIVLSFFWSAALTIALVYFVDGPWTQKSLIQLTYLTVAPLTLLWSIYLAARWVRQGAKRK